MNKAALRKRIERLEDIFDAGRPVPTRNMDGTFTGTIRDGGALTVRISRPLVFNRDADGSWLIYSWQEGQDREPESLTVTDATACDALDALFELTANPDDFTGCTIDGDDGTE